MGTPAVAPASEGPAHARRAETVERTSGGRALTRKEPRVLKTSRRSPWKSGPAPAHTAPTHSALTRFQQAPKPGTLVRATGHPVGSREKGNGVRAPLLEALTEEVAKKPPASPGPERKRDFPGWC